MTPSRSDVAVVGGGMAGMTLAIALAKGGLRVQLIDRILPQEMASENFDGRVSALAYSPVRMLRALGLWDRLEADAQPIHQILVNEGRPGGHALPFSLHFDHREIGETLGHIVENRHIRRVLLSAIAGEPNIRFTAGVSVTGLSITQVAAELELSNGEQIAATLVAAAEGREFGAKGRAGNRRHWLGLRPAWHRHHGGARAPARRGRL